MHGEEEVGRRDGLSIQINAEAEILAVEGF
jgi:hypothetical protein